MLTVKMLRDALEGLPDDMPVHVEKECSEGCGTSADPAYGWRVEELYQGAGPAKAHTFVVSDET